MFALVIVTAGPVWSEIVDFVHSLPAYWDELQTKDWFQTLTSTAGVDDTMGNALKNLAAGLPEAASTLLGITGGIFGSFLSLVTLTFLSLFLLMERPTITTWLFGFTPPEVDARWNPVVEESISAVSSRCSAISPSLSSQPSSPTSAWAFGLPFPLVLALIAGFLDLIPQVGATVAAVILVAVGLTVSAGGRRRDGGDPLIYQQLGELRGLSIVYRRAVELSALRPSSPS